jgi:2-haloacid dehalogenase
VTRTVDAVVFDLGNVLVRWDPHRPYVGRMERAEVDAFFDEIDFPSLNDRQDAGRPWAEARAEVHRRFPHRADAFDFYIEHFAETLVGPVDGTERLVRDLVHAEVRVLGLTNWSAETFHHAEPAAPAIGLLEDVLVSGAVGIAKPDPRIFRLLASRYALDQARTVFTDDSARNVEAAAAEGFDAVLFTDADRLRADLARRGLPVASP